MTGNDNAMGDSPAQTETRAVALEDVKTSLIEAADGQQQRIRRSEHENRVWRLVAVGVLIIQASILGSLAVYIVSGRHTTKDTHHLVQEIDAALSPAAQAKSAANTEALVAELVDRIDCTNRADLQDVITRLELSGVLKPAELILTCPTPTH